MSWQQSTIDEACLLVTDGTHYTPPDVGQGIPFLTVKDCSNDGHIDLIGCSHITGDEFAKAEKGNSAPKRGDILFSKDGTVGKVYVVDTSCETFAVLSSLAILRPDGFETRRQLLRVEHGCSHKTDSLPRPSFSEQDRSRLRNPAPIILKDLIERVRFPLPPLACSRSGLRGFWMRRTPCGPSASRGPRPARRRIEPSWCLAKKAAAFFPIVTFNCPAPTASRSSSPHPTPAGPRRPCQRTVVALVSLPRPTMSTKPDQAQVDVEDG